MEARSAFRRFQQLKKAWKEARPDSTRCPSNYTIHKWLQEADSTAHLDGHCHHRTRLNCGRSKRGTVRKSLCSHHRATAVAMTKLSRHAAAVDDSSSWTTCACTTRRWSRTHCVTTYPARHRFLPTYSPHLNPIEYCFHNWKTEIKHVDQLHDRRGLREQLDDTRTCITAHLVTRILDHVYQYYTHCLQGLPLEDFKPIGCRVLRARQEAERQRQDREEDEKKE